MFTRNRNLAALGVAVTIVVAAGASTTWAATSKKTTKKTVRTATTKASTATTKASTVATKQLTGAATSTTSATGGTTGPTGIADAGAKFVAVLSPAELKSVQFLWTDTAQKQRWSNFPSVGFQRAGLRWGDMKPAARSAWLDMMKVSLSAEGYARVMAQFNADEVVFKTEGQDGFGINFFYVALIGKPAATGPWIWQFGGHHVTVNATVLDSHIVSVTPSYMGSQPLTYKDSDGKTVRPLGDIEDEGLALVQSLDATQSKTAVVANSPIDVVLGPGQDGKTIPPEGLPGSKMTSAQKEAFLKLIAHYVGLPNSTDAIKPLADAKANLDRTYFAWFGPTTAGQAAYMRITGPTVVIEYAPQGDRPGQAVTGVPNHAHGMYRDPTNDYGAKFAK